MNRSHRGSPERSQDPAAEARARLSAHLSSAGLNHSRTRDAVVEAFLAAPGHVSVDELTVLVHRRGPAVGHSTVYRTMKLLVECGIAAPHDFGDGQTRYERALHRTHHDHLICKECGAIVEFEDRRIEDLQDAVAKRYSFEVTSHKMELYGTCAGCARADWKGTAADARVHT